MIRNILKQEFKIHQIIIIGLVMFAGFSIIILSARFYADIRPVFTSHDLWQTEHLVISKEDEFSKGSARSVDGFNIIKFLRQFGEFFEDLGGHPMAAGFNLKTENIKKLKEKIEEKARKQIKDKLLVPKIKIDAEIEFKDINWQLYNKLQKFSPFGLGNPRPVFSLKKARVNSVKTVGRIGNHLKLYLENGRGKSFEAIAFKQGKKIKNIKSGSFIDICFNLEKNSWNGNESLQFIVKDLKV